MAGLKTLLGLFPKTASFEAKRKQIAEEYATLNEFTTSDTLKRYNELKDYVNSEEFTSTKKELLGLNYKASEEYKLEQEFIVLQKSKDIKGFFKTEGSAQLTQYSETKESKELARKIELEELVKSEAFIKVKNYYKQSGKKRFQESDLGKTLADYEQKKKSERIKGYQKFINHKLFNDYKEIAASDKLQKFEELEKTVQSKEFADKKATMKKAEFADSPEAQQLADYKEQKKDSQLKNYYKLSKSPLLKFYKELNDSPEYEAFEELEKFVLSDDFKTQRAEIEKKTFKDTEEFAQESELSTLTKDPKIKAYYKFDKSKELANYKAIKDSDKLKRFEELKEQIEKDEFKKQKEYLSQKPKVRWEASDAFAKFDEFEKLKNSKEIKWYFANLKHKKFDWHKKWELTFEDDFGNHKLDTKKWLTRYYWGDELLDKPYSLENELQFNTDGENIDFEVSDLKITTKLQQAEGLRWNPEYGFLPSDYDYTGGLINSGRSFRQKYGLFEAKIKFSTTNKVLNAFWMVGDMQTPHIDVVKANGKCSFGVIRDETNTDKFKKAISRNRYNKDYHIFSLEWTESQMTWYINGLDVATLNNNIPQEEMYLVFSSGLYQAVQNNSLPASMHIDWVRCYKNISSSAE